MDEFSSKRQSSDGRQEHTFHCRFGPLQRSHQGDHREIAGYGAGYGTLQLSHRGDNQEIQVMVQVMGLFSILIKETIRRLQVTVQVMGIFSVHIEEIAGYGAGYGPLQCSHQGDHHEIAGSSEFSSRMQSSDRPMRGRDLIM